MRFCGDRDKQEDGRPEQKWNYFNLSDFKSTSCVAPLSYGVLYYFLLVSVAVYVVDVFTAANLLFFDRWSGQVQPVIPFTYARWIFAGCIILSWILLLYRWMRAIRVIRGGVVAASYLDPLAVRVQSVRTGQEGRGWRRFLVFAALTKGRKGAEYVALFTFFSFEAWLRIVFAEGPRQIINAATLYTVMQANLVPTGQHAAIGSNSSIRQFFVNVQILAHSNREQAAILFGMLFTLIIWLFSVLSLILAVLFYVFFLWARIPSSDGSLAKYCRRKVDKRLSQIVGVNINKAIERENRQMMQTEAKSDGRSLKRQPTLPILGDDEEVSLRHTSQGSSQPSGRDGHEDRRPRLTLPSRIASQMSAQSSISHGSVEPLMAAGSAVGYDGAGRPYSPAPPSVLISERSYPPSKPGLNRFHTQSSQISYRSHETAWAGPTPISPSQITPGSYCAVSTKAAEFPEDFAPVYSRNATHASFRSLGDGCKPVRRGVLEGRDSYGLQSSYPDSRVIRPNPLGYTAYNPTLHNRQKAYHDFYSPRSATAPPTQQSSNLSRRRPPTDYFGQVGLQAQRSGTAPPDVGRISTSAAWAAQKGVMDRY